MCGVMGDGVTEGGVETIIKHGQCVCMVLFNCRIIMSWGIIVVQLVMTKTN